MKKRRIICLILAVTFLMSLLLSVTAFAQETNVDIESNPILMKQASEQIANVITSIKRNPLEYEYTEEELNVAYIGQQFQIKDLEEQNKTEKLFYYPIISGDDVIGIISIIHNDGSIISVTAGRSFAEKLNEVIQSEGKQKNISLVFDKSGIKAVNDKNQVFDIFSNPSFVENNTKRGVIYTLDKENHMEIDTLYEKNTVFTMDKISVGPRAAEKYLTNYPIVAQGGDPICWAASIATILRFEVPGTFGSIDGRGVCSRVGHSLEPANPKEARSYLDQLLPAVYKPTYIGSSLSYSDVMVIINNVDPLYVSARTSDDADGHAVVICGYNLYNTGFVTRIMNPGTARYESMSMNSASPSFAYNGKAHYWKASVRLLY